MIQATASTQLNNHTVGEAGGVEKHNERLYEKNKNEFINKQNEDLNVHANIDSLETLHQSLKDEINAKNKNVIENYTAGKYSRKQFEDKYIVDEIDFLSRANSKKEPSGKKAIGSYIFQIGGTDFYRELLKRENIQHTFDEEKGFTYPNKDDLKKVVDLYNKTYQAVADKLAESGAFVPYTFDMHMDEGYPHAHAQFLNNGTTAKGARSYSSNQSIHDFLEYNGVKAGPVGSRNANNMKLFRDYVDGMMMDEFNKNLAAGNFVTRDVQLVRTADTEVKAAAKSRKTAMQNSAKKINQLDDDVAKKSDTLKDLNSKVRDAKSDLLVMESQIDILKAEKKTLEEDAKTFKAQKKALDDDRTKWATEKVLAEQEADKASNKLTELNKGIVDAESVRKASDVVKDVLLATGAPENVADGFAKGKVLNKSDGTKLHADEYLTNQIIKMSKSTRQDFELEQMSKLNESRKRQQDKEMEL